MAKPTTAPLPLNDRLGAVAQPLAHLEMCLETPVIPGELDTWMDAVAQAVGGLRAVVQATYAQTHTGLFREMCSQDDGMLSRVDQLKREDLNILVALDKFADEVACLQQRCTEPDQTETELRDCQQDIAQAGIALVVRARTQETAIGTWYLEAFDRDSGNKD